MLHGLDLAGATTNVASCSGFRLVGVPSPLHEPPLIFRRPYVPWLRRRNLTCRDGTISSGKHVFADADLQGRRRVSVMLQQPPQFYAFDKEMPVRRPASVKKFAHDAEAAEAAGAAAAAGTGAYTCTLQA
jgi:hypothetical protein